MGLQTATGKFEVGTQKVGAHCPACGEIRYLTTGSMNPKVVWQWVPHPVPRVGLVKVTHCAVCDRRFKVEAWT